MFRPLALYIGLRYTRAKRRNHFISFISLTSLLGIALGVAVLITAMSVMNGFDEVIRGRILSVARQVAVNNIEGKVIAWKPLEEKLRAFPGVLGTAPLVDGQGMLAYSGNVRPANIVGILPTEEQAVSVVGQKIIEGSMDALVAGKFGIVIGQELADALGLQVGDKVTVITSQPNLTPMGISPRLKSFTVVGIFKVGNGIGYDSGVAFIHLQDAQKLFQLGTAVTGIRLKIQDLYQAPEFSHRLAKILSPDYRITNWTLDYGALFSAIKMEKTMIFLLLTLLIAIAAFNLVSTLVMVVTDKKSDIAILRTFGATPRMIMGIFVVQGGVVGVLGTLLGLIGGLLLAWNISDLVSAVEHFFNVKLFASNFYYVNYLPSKLEWSDVRIIISSALVMSLFATLYPAWTASRTQPAEALRYE